MIVAYRLDIHDDDSTMLGPDTFRPPPGSEFYDWRFGKDGVPHPATCSTCGRKTDPDFINPNFRVKRRKRDLSMTYDGFALVSNRFRRFCEDNGWHKHVDFVSLPGDEDFFAFRPTRQLSFDSDRRRTRFEKLCPGCDQYFNVIGASPTYLLDVDATVLTGFYRTDLEFGSGHEQSPLIIVCTETADCLKHEAFGKVDLEAIGT